MATPLAIEPLAAQRRNPRASPAVAPVRTQDDMADRPPIPRGVVDWSDCELPVGAGDPAVAIDGPPSFHAWREAAPRPEQAGRLESALFASVLAAFLAAVSLAAVDVARGAAASAALHGQPALIGRVPIVETRILSLQPVIDTASRAPAANGSAQGG